MVNTFIFDFFLLKIFSSNKNMYIFIQFLYENFSFHPILLVKQENK